MQQVEMGSFAWGDGADSALRESFIAHGHVSIKSALRSRACISAT